MVWETGSATDYQDLLLKFRDFITGVSSPASGLTWVVNRDTSGDSPEPTDIEMMFQGNGGGSPEDEIYFGIQTQQPGAGLFSWQIRGYTGFEDGSPEGSITFEDQPGSSLSSSVYLALRNAAMTYWFVGNDRFVQGVIRTGTAYQHFGAGLIDRYSTSNDYPYPLFVTGSTSQADQAFGDNDVGFTMCSYPIAAPSRASNELRWVDGSWYSFFNATYSGSGNENSSGEHCVWPMSHLNTNTPDVNDLQDAITMPEMVRAQAVGGTPNGNLWPTPGSPVCPPLFPLTLFFSTAVIQNFVGEVPDMFWVSGEGVVAEDLVVDTTVSPEVTYIVFQNVHRTDKWMWFAMRLNEN